MQAQKCSGNKRATQARTEDGTRTRDWGALRSRDPPTRAPPPPAQPPAIRLSAAPPTDATTIMDGAGRMPLPPPPPPAPMPLPQWAAHRPVPATWPGHPYPFSIDGLSAEIHDFCQYATLRPDEIAARARLRAAIDATVARLWGPPGPDGSSGPRTLLFGSYALGLSVPCSDLDLTVVFPFQPSAASGVDPVTRLRRLAEALEEPQGPEGHGLSLQAALHAECRVPVVQVEDRASGVSADISIGMPHMERVVEMQTEWLAGEEALALREAAEKREAEGPSPAASPSLPLAALSPLVPVRALIVLTKLALRQWGLGSSFSGGLSSTAVYLLAERFLREGRALGFVPSPPPPVGRLLLDFWAYLCNDTFTGGYNATDIFFVAPDERQAFNPSALSRPITPPPMGVPAFASAPTDDSELQGSRPHTPYSRALSPASSPGPASLPHTNAVDDDGQTSTGVSPTCAGPSSFPMAPASPVRRQLQSPLPGGAVAPDVTRRCARLREIMMLFQHSYRTIEQLVAPGQRSPWGLLSTPTPLSAVLTEPRGLERHRRTHAHPMPAVVLPQAPLQWPPPPRYREAVATSPLAANGSNSDGSRQPTTLSVGAPCFVPRARRTATSPVSC